MTRVSPSSPVSAPRTPAASASMDSDAYLCSSANPPCCLPPAARAASGNLSARDPGRPQGSPPSLPFPQLSNVCKLVSCIFCPVFYLGRTSRVRHSQSKVRLPVSENSVSLPVQSLASLFNSSKSSLILGLSLPASTLGNAPGPFKADLRCCCHPMWPAFPK